MFGWNSWRRNALVITYIPVLLFGKYSKRYYLCLKIVAGTCITLKLYQVMYRYNARKVGDIQLFVKYEIVG